jgi:hypothetical protein
MNSKPLYVCIPRRLLLHPPIAHRGSNASARVTPFEFAVLAGVLVEARAELYRHHHELASAAGRNAMERQRGHYRSYTEDCRRCKAKRARGQHADWPQITYEFDPHRFYDERKHNLHKPIPIKEAIQVAGRVAYRNKLQRLRKQPPPPVLQLKLSCYSLLRAAGLANNGDNNRRLDGALDRLCREVGSGALPALASWRTQAGQLELQVAGAWLAPPYACIGLPLPRSATALALTLFLQAIHSDRAYPRWSHLPSLCARLGLPWRGPERAWRALDRALEIVNQLTSAQSESERPGGLYGDEFVPAWYELVPFRGKGVRFKAYREDERDDAGEDAEASVEELVEQTVAARPKPKRQRLSAAPERRRLAEPAQRQHDVDLQERRQELLRAQGD